MKKTILLSGLILICSIMQVNAQLTPIVTKAKYFDKTPPLREMKLIVPGVRDRSWKDNVIKNKLELPAGNPGYRNTGPDPVWQNDFGKQKNNEPIFNFNGTGNVSNILPPDTDGDVGLNHYFQIVNLAFQIFDKEGNSLYGPADNSTLWSGFIGPWTGHNDGDPIVAYDELADRWIASQFAIECTGNTYWELVAVSATPDPLGSWYRYAFEYPVLNDYPKLSVWPDAYYCSFNLHGDDYIRVGASAYEREAMLVGDTNARHVLFDLPEEMLSWAMLPADFDGTPPENGSPSYWICMTDDDYIWWTEDQIRIWEFKVDWDNPQNSTFEEVQDLNPEPFNFQLCNAGELMDCIPQPDGAPALDALSQFSMQPLQYRNFGTYETMVFNHTVNADGNGLAGIRWYELRQENEEDGWYIYQQGTYAPDEHHRWMGSIAMDARGYIALGYTVSSTSVYPSLRYTGRPPDAPLGEMTFLEEEIIAGTGSQLSSYHRWGDYSMMAVDPSNDTTFWYTGEYMQTTSDRDWKTRIAAFNLSIDEIPPAAITDLQTQNTTTNAIMLNWTATGNNGNAGTAYYYDIRQHDDPINEDNWENTTVVENAISPAESGTPETFIVEGLGYSTDYYFAIKAIDKQNNISEVSNSPLGTVAGTPQIVLEESAVEVKIFEPGIVNRPYMITNTGETVINYKLIKEVLAIPENEGVVLDTLENGVIFNRGMVWANGYLYMLERINSHLYKYDTALQMKVDSFDVHNDPYGLAWDGAYFWIGDNNGIIHAYDVNGISAGLSFSCPFSGKPALTSSGEYYVVAELKSYPKIFFLDQNGNEIKMYHTNMPYAPSQFAWADDHYNSNLWFNYQNGRICQLSFDGDSALISISFEGPANKSATIAHDGCNLWQGQNFGTLFRIDDGIDEISWFSAEPAEGTIAPVASAEINLQANLTNLPEKDTSTVLRIISNDPVNNSIFTPFHIVYSTIDLGVDTSFCSNLNILLDAGDGYKEYLWSDGSNEQTLLIDSTGYGLGTFALWVEALDYGDGTFRDTVLITFEDCTGLEEYENECNFSISPNPMNDLAFLSLNIQSISSVEICIYNITGICLKNWQFQHQQPGEKEYKLDLKDLPAGVYFCRVQIGNETITNKIIKIQ